jgi:hypothetical protein
MEVSHCLEGAIPLKGERAPAGDRVVCVLLFQSIFQSLSPHGPATFFGKNTCTSAELSLGCPAAAFRISRLSPAAEALAVGCALQSQSSSVAKLCSCGAGKSSPWFDRPMIDFPSCSPHQCLTSRRPVSFCCARSSATARQQQPPHNSIIKRGRGCLCWIFPRALGEEAARRHQTSRRFLTGRDDEAWDREDMHTHRPLRASLSDMIKMGAGRVWQSGCVWVVGVMICWWYFCWLPPDEGDTSSLLLIAGVAGAANPCGGAGPVCISSPHRSPFCICPPRPLI